MNTRDKFIEKLNKHRYLSHCEFSANVWTFRQGELFAPNDTDDQIIEKFKNCKKLQIIRKDVDIFSVSMNGIDYEFTFNESTKKNSEIYKIIDALIAEFVK